MIPDTSSWKKIGAVSNAEIFEVDSQVLAVVPFEGTADDAAAARESIRIQLEHLRPRGRRAGVVIFVDPLVDQSAAARAVYAEAPDPVFQACCALVGSSIFGQAVGSVFVGLHRPKVPTKLFTDFEEAVAWIRAILPAT